MEEKKLTDDEIVKATEICCDDKSYNCEGCPLRDEIGCVRKRERAIVDLIHRLQDENADLREKRMDAEFAIDKWMEENKKQQEEIERLTEENEHLNKLLEERRWEEISFSKKIVAENTELQKQVDELKNNRLKGEIIVENVNELMNEIEEQCCDCKAWSGTDCTRNPYTQGCLKDEKQVIECHGMLEGCDMVKQAVKDTAKEIFAELCGHGTTYVKKWIKERYGVEVE